jgi:predicted Zn-dependent peptidase
MGASLDVRTTHDTISFVGEVIKENTIPFLKLVEDCILHPRFGTTDFNELKTETIADIANWKNSNNRLSGLALRKVLFAGTPLEHPSDGSLSTVAAITLKDVTSEYKKVITQGNLVFGVASPLKQADVQAVLWPIWKGLPKSERVKRTSIAPKLPTTPQLVVINKPKTSTGALVFGQAGITVHDPYRYTLGVANYAFGSEPLISRLFRIVRSELGYTYSIGSSYGTMGALSDQEGIFTISATPSVEFTTKTMLKVLDLWHDYLKTGLGGGELNLAHESMVNSYPFEFDSADKRLGEKLYSYIYGVPVLSPAEYKKTIDAVDRAQIQHALASRQTGDGWVITLVADADEIRKQLDEQQKDTPKEKRLTISKTFTPDEIIE